MIRAWFALGIAFLFVREALGQDSRPSATDSQAVPNASATPAPAPRYVGSLGGFDYTIEMKIVEENGQLIGSSDRPSPDGERPQGFERQTLEKAIAPRSLPRPAQPQTISVGTSDSGKPSAKDLGPRKAQPKPRDIWDISSDELQGRTVQAPKMLVRSKTSAYLGLENPQRFSYLEPLGDDNFRHKRTDVKKLGMKFTIAPQPIEGDENSVELSVDIETTTLDGREAVEGLDLNAGKPIIATRSLKTTARMKLGVTRTIVIPSGPTTQAVLLLRVNRFEPPTKD